MSKYDYAMNVLTWERNSCDRKLQNTSDMYPYNVAEKHQLKEQIAELVSAIEVLRKEGRK